MYAVFNPRKSYKENTLTFHFQKNYPDMKPSKQHEHILTSRG